MKKLICLFLLMSAVAFGQTYTGTTKAGKFAMYTPELGTVNDSVALWDGSTKVLKYIPRSVFLSGLGGGSVQTLAQTMDTGALTNGDAISSPSGLSFVNIADDALSLRWEGTYNKSIALNDSQFKFITTLHPFTFVGGALIVTDADGSPNTTYIDQYVVSVQDDTTFPHIGSGLQTEGLYTKQNTGKVTIDAPDVTTDTHWRFPETGGGTRFFASQADIAAAVTVKKEWVAYISGQDETGLVGVDVKVNTLTGTPDISFNRISTGAFEVINFDRDKYILTATTSADQNNKAAYSREDDYFFTISYGVGTIDYVFSAGGWIKIEEY